MNLPPDESAVQELRAQLARIEAELARMDTQFQQVGARLMSLERSGNPSGPGTTGPAAPLPATKPAAAPRTPLPARSHADDGHLAARWMAGGAATAFLLAAVYLLRVVYDSGWLTPAREIALAVLGAGVLIAAGLWLAREDRAGREYAAWLPAAGSVILYVAAYGAHLYYDLIGRHAAIAAVAAAGLLTLWLGRRFDHAVFAVFAVLGTYLFPLWLPAGSTPAGDLFVYFTAWSLAFAAASLLEARRLTYVLAMFCALLGFQLAWLLNGIRTDWQPAAIFQLFQFLLFALTAVTFSIVHRRGMDAADTLAHGVALFCFYAFEYSLLRSHAPELAGPLALASALFVLAVYLVARRALPAAQRQGGAILASSYCSVVTAHILFFEWLPDDLIPWAALLSPAFVLAATPLFRDAPGALWPLRIVAAFVFAIGFMATLTGGETHTPLPDLVLFAYAGALYAGYLLLRRGERDASDAGTALLYAAHVSALLAFSRWLDSGFTISVAWGALALATLALAVALRDRNLARSSLIIFAASGLKTLLVDLQDSDSLLRVLTLLVVGATLYAGGWLYQRIFRNADSAHPARTP
ncbi:MAG: DUF2339 domain-containing protein [Pseudomonadota bacterium]